MKKYHILLRMIHWLMAICILGLIAVGWYMTEVKVADGKYFYYDLHKSFGVLILLLLTLRFLVRSFTDKPELPDGIRPVERLLSHVAHILLYVLMIFVPVAGYIYSSAGGYAVKLFGLTLPNLIGKTPWLFDIAHVAHQYSAYALLAVVGMHLAGALKHRLFDVRENDVLGRMI